MKKHLSTAVAALLFVSLACPLSQAAHLKQDAKNVETGFKNDLAKVGHGVKSGAEKVGDGMKKGAHKVESAFHKGHKKTDITEKKS